MLFIAQESKTCPYDSQAPRMQASSVKKMIDTCFIVVFLLIGYSGLYLVTEPPHLLNSIYSFPLFL